MQEENIDNQLTISALLLKIKQLEEENAKLRNAIIYQWLNGNKDE